MPVCVGREGGGGGGGGGGQSDTASPIEISKAE